MEAAYEAQWDAGRGSHHPDYDPVSFRVRGRPGRPPPFPQAGRIGGQEGEIKIGAENPAEGAPPHYTHCPGV